MKNRYALHHANRLHGLGADPEYIDKYLRTIATRNERREILATLEPDPGLALAA